MWRPESGQRCDGEPRPRGSSDRSSPSTRAAAVFGVKVARYRYCVYLKGLGLDGCTLWSRCTKFLQMSSSKSGAPTAVLSVVRRRGVLRHERNVARDAPQAAGSPWCQRRRPQRRRLPRRGAHLVLKQFPFGQWYAVGARLMPQVSSKILDTGARTASRRNWTFASAPLHGRLSALPARRSISASETSRSLSMPARRCRGLPRLLVGQPLPLAPR